MVFHKKTARSREETTRTNRKASDFETKAETKHVGRGAGLAGLPFLSLSRCMALSISQRLERHHIITVHGGGRELKLKSDTLQVFRQVMHLFCRLRLSHLPSNAK